MNIAPNGFTALSRGGPSPYPADSIPKNGVHFHLDKGRVDLTIFLERPAKEEMDSYRKGQAEFGLFVHGPVIFFLSKFGALPWGDAPYSIRRVPLQQRGLPSGYEPGKRFGLHVMLVDSGTNTIQALRFTTLSPELSELLAKEVVKQMHTPLPLDAYDRAISKAYALYPTAESMKEHALIVCADTVETEEPSSTAADTSPSATESAASEPRSASRVPDAFAHITLNTTHTSITRPGDVHADVITMLSALISDSVRTQSSVAIKGFQPYEVKVAVDDLTMFATVYKRAHAALTPIISIGVALDATSGVKLWNELHDTALLPVATTADQAPKGPWIAARFEKGFYMALGASLWLGDFERCLGWAFAHWFAEHHASA